MSPDPRQPSFFRPGFRSDAGSSAPDTGLVACSVCRCIASKKCLDCAAAYCDDECRKAHRMEAHPMFAVVKRVA